MIGINRFGEFPSDSKNINLLYLQYFETVMTENRNKFVALFVTHKVNIIVQ